MNEEEERSSGQSRVWRRVAGWNYSTNLVVSNRYAKEGMINGLRTPVSCYEIKMTDPSQGGRLKQEEQRSSDGANP